MRRVVFGTYQPFEKPGEKVFDGAVNRGIAQRVFVGVALPSDAEAPRVKVTAALPVALAGVPAPFSIVGEYRALAVAGDEDVVAHLTCRVCDPGDTTTITSV